VTVVKIVETIDYFSLLVALSFTLTAPAKFFDWSHANMLEQSGPMKMASIFALCNSHFGLCINQCRRSCQQVSILAVPYYIARYIKTA